MSMSVTLNGTVCPFVKRLVGSKPRGFTGLALAVKRAGMQKARLKGLIKLCDL